MLAASLALAIGEVTPLSVPLKAAAAAPKQEAARENGAEWRSPAVLMQLSVAATSGSQLMTRSHAAMMVTGLLGVPILTAAIAFLLVELAATEPSDPFRAPPPRTPAFTPTRSMHSTPRLSTYSNEGYSVHAHPTSQNLQTAGVLASVASIQPRTACSFASPPSSLPRLSVRSTGPASNRDSSSEDSRNGSPLALSLLVRHPSGTFVRLDGSLLPHPESRTINVLSVKDNEAMLCCQVSETTAGAPAIHISTSAPNTPIAVLDTSQAIFHRGAPKPPLGQRRVVLHQTIGDGRAATGPPCAWVSGLAGGAFIVHYMSAQQVAPGIVGDVALRVHTSEDVDNHGTYLERMLDPRGEIVAEAKSVGRGPKAIWVRQGFDMAFVACVTLAIQKLA